MSSMTQTLSRLLRPPWSNPGARVSASPCPSLRPLSPPSANPDPGVEANGTASRPRAAVRSFIPSRSTSPAANRSRGRRKLFRGHVALPGGAGRLMTARQSRFPASSLVLDGPEIAHTFAWAGSCMSAKNRSSGRAAGSTFIRATLARLRKENRT